MTARRKPCDRLASLFGWACLVASVGEPALAQRDDTGSGTASAVEDQAPIYAITHIRGDLYRYRHSGEYSLFLVTSQGIVLVDPLAEVDNQAPEWLKGQLAQRFGVPVRYVIYSHHHIDRAAGGDVFADTATFIAHRNLPEKLEPPPADRPISPDFAGLDIDGDGYLSLPEASLSVLGPPRFPRWDIDGDGRLSGADIAITVVKGVRAPDIVYSRHMTLELGEHRIELIHPGPNHSDDMTVVYFPRERAVFQAGILRAFSGLPTGYFSGRPMPQWIASFRAIEALDFDTLIPGGGPVGGKADVILTRMAWEALHTAVAAGIEQGRTLEELQRSIRLDDFSAYPGHETRLPRSVAEAYRAITAHER